MLIQLHNIVDPLTVCCLIRDAIGLNIFYSEEKDWARHTTRQCPLQRKYLQKNLITHTHMYTHTSKNRMFDNTKRNNN